MTRVVHRQRPDQRENSKPNNKTWPTTKPPRRRAFQKRNPNETESRDQNQPSPPTGAIAGAAPKTPDCCLYLTDRT
jgi:hypothetical protein